MKPNLQSAVLLHDAYWAIEPQAAQAILAQLRNTDANVHRAEFDAMREALAARPSAEASTAPPYQMNGHTAIISVSGAMTKKGSSFGNGGTIATRQQIRHAGKNPDVKNWAMVWDSPGGSVAGTEDLANDIAWLQSIKPGCSFMEDSCCSAALWGAVQAGSVYANSTAIIGSIGVFSYVIDSSRMHQNAGIEVYLLATGKYKGAGAIDGVPVNEEQRAEMLRTVATLGTAFVNAFAKGRNMAIADADELADGRVWVGQEAVEVGIIDGVASLDDVLNSMKAAPGRRSFSASTPEGFQQEEATGVLLLTPNNLEGFQQEEATGVLLLTPNNLASSNVPPIGMTMEQSLDSALTAVEGSRKLVETVSERIAQVRDLRESQHRSFSPARLKQIEALDTEIAELALAMEELSATCKALGSPPAATAPVAPTPALDEAFNRALLDAAFDQAISA